MSLRRVALRLLPLWAAATLAAAEDTTHDLAFWGALPSQGCELPGGESHRALALELVKLLGERDPALRDDIGYTLLARWTLRDGCLGEQTLRELMTRLLPGLRHGLEDGPPDTVLRRSFSALALSLVAARDSRAPFLSVEEHAALLEAALAYLAAEHDLRGYESELGWIHATAHTADLLKFLARGKQLPVVAQQRLYDAIALRLVTAGQVFTHGEDERLARVVQSLVARGDFQRQAFEHWLEAFELQASRVWHGARIDRSSYDATMNARNLLLVLQLLLELQPEPSAGQRWARERVMETLKQL